MRKITLTMLTVGLSVLACCPALRAADDWNSKYSNQLKQTQAKVKERILKDLDTVEMAMGELPLPSDEKKPVFDELKQVTEYAKTTPFPTKLKGFRTIIPFNQEHAKVFKAWSMILRDKGLKGIHIWHIDRFAKFKLFDTPNRTPVRDISLKMMRNERRSQAINLTNCTAKAQTVKLTVADIPATVRMRLFYTVFVDTKKLKAVPSALFPAKKSDSGWSLPLNSGMTTQVWFMVDSNKVKAGKYSLPITVTAAGKSQNLTFKLEFSPVTFPDRTKMTHSLNMFDSAISGARGIGKALSESERAASIKASIKDLDDHLVSSFVVTSSNSPLPSYGRENFDDQGNLVTKPDLTKFKKTFALYPEKVKYHIYAMAFKKGKGNYGFGGLPIGSKASENALIQWLKYFENACKELKINPQKIVLMSYDEPRSNDALKIAHDTLKIIKDNSSFKTFCTIGARGAKNPYCAKAIAVTDLVQPCRRHINELYGKKKKMFLNIPAEEGRELWLYDCGYKSSPLFYLKGAWQDALWGAVGTGYWAYCDTGDNPGNWNMYPQFRTSRKRDNYAPQYIDFSGVTISREWEAIREGVENCEYMHMLRSKNPKSPLLKNKVPKTLEQVKMLRLKVLNALEK